MSSLSPDCRRQWFALGLAFVLGVSGIMSARGQETVYVLPSDVNALLTWGAYPPTAGVMYGDDAHLGGTNRLLQSVTVPVASNVQRSATMELALYRRGAGGYPGALLWSEIRNVNFAQPANGNDLVRQVLFGPVDLVVPSDLVWAVKFTNITNYDPNVANLSFFGLIWNEADNLLPAGASNDVSVAYRQLPAQPWQVTTGPTMGGVPHDATMTISMTADPVPEPGLAGLWGVVGLLLLRRRRG